MIAKDVREFLKQFELTLAVLAREGRQAELESRLEDFRKLVAAWLDVAPEGAAPPDRMRFLMAADRFAGPFEIDMRRIAEAAVRSGDSSTVVALANQLIRNALVCRRRGQPRLMEDCLNAVVVLYSMGAEREGLAQALGSHLDNSLHSLLLDVWGNRPEMKERSQWDSSKNAFLDVVLRFSLALVNVAIRADQVKHAAHFVERIFEHRNFRPFEGVVTGPVVIGPEALFDYVAIVLVGWSLRTLQCGEARHSTAAKSVLLAAMNQVPSVPMLVAEWEVLRGGAHNDAAIDNRLGVAHWEFRDSQKEYRAGMGEAYWSGDDWVRLGLRASLLGSRHRYLGDPSWLFSCPPRRLVWDAVKEREALQTLVSDQWLGIPGDEHQQRVEAAMSTIERRARDANAEYLAYVLDSPLSESRIADLRDDAIETYLKKRPMQEALCRAGLGSGQARSCPLRTRWGVWMPREYLLDDNSWVSGFGAQLGEAIAMRQAMALVYLIETGASRGGNLIKLAMLPETLRDARRKMSASGSEPNVVILPSEDRFAGALFGKPLWQVERQQYGGAASFGMWEGLHVLRFPYVNPNSILLLDSRRLLGDCGSDPEHSGDRVWIEDRTQNVEVESTKAAARAALSSAGNPMPDSSAVKVLALMEVSPHIGIHDSEAAMAIEIRKCDGMFAVVEKSNVYHRPSCPEVVGQQVEYLLHVRPHDGPSPCPSCRPEQWDIEARIGSLDARHGS